MIYDNKYICSKINKDTENIVENEINQILERKNFSEEELLNAFSEIRLKLGQYFKLDNINFVIGNGCSIYAGSKSTMDFNIFNVIENEKIESILDVINKISGNPLEEQLNELLTIKEFYHIVGDKKEEIVNEIIQTIKKNLLDNYVNSIDYNKLKYHEDMLLKLRSFGCINKINIFTLNYDLAWEYVLDKLSIKYEDGFTGFVNRAFDPSSLLIPNIAKLYKIHGSVNWIFDSKDRMIKELQPRYKNGKVELENADHVLIYPTEQKLYQTYNAPYSELMRNMLDTFEVKKNLIMVIGYKYGDEHINDILYKAVANPNNIFYFFDFDGGNCDFIQHMIELSNNVKNINIFLGVFLANFKNIVKYILPSNVEKTDQEKIFELLGKVMNND